jgi:alpha-tubulin suppressor-like RCC1 family protein
MALTWDGTLYTFGYGLAFIELGANAPLVLTFIQRRNCLFGELGLGGFEEVWTPKAVGGLLTGKKVTTISAGASHSLAITEDGKVPRVPSFPEQAPTVPFTGVCLWQWRPRRTGIRRTDQRSNGTQVQKT